MWEYKFVFKDDRIAEPTFDLISKMKDFAGYDCRFSKQVENEDYYFDTPDLRLDSLGMVFRLRRSKDEDSERFCLTIKRQSLGPNREVIYPEASRMLQEDEFQRIKDGGFPAHYEQILKIFAGRPKLENALVLRVSRTVMVLLKPLVPFDNNTHPGEAAAEAQVSVSPTQAGPFASLNLDRITPIYPDRLEVRGYEIELKSARESFPEADVLQDALRNAFHFIPVTRSKARRLVPAIRRQKEGTEPSKVILDMDTGVDDALAIILAMNSPELEVLGITTVSGNVAAEQCGKNTAAVLGLFKRILLAHYPGSEVTIPPVACGRAPAGHLPNASDVHSPDGLGGVTSRYGDSSAVSNCSAVDLYMSLVDRYPPGTITLITTGPLTNLAHWIEEAPEAVKRLRAIVSMGGVFFESGNRSQAAEFNIHADPVSARRAVRFCRQPVSSVRYAWRETIPLTFIGLDVTHRVRLRREILQKAVADAANDDVLSEQLAFIEELTRFYMDFYYRNEGFDGCYLHDPLAVGYVIDPSLFHVEQYHIEVEDKGRWTSGMTVADYRPTRLFKDHLKECAWVCYKVDAQRFERLFVNRVLGPFGLFKSGGGE